MNDARERRRALVAARDRFRGGAPGEAAVDLLAPDVRASWNRCVRSVATRATAPLELTDPAEIWASSPIRIAAPEVIDELANLATREDYVAAITDPDGRIIWSSAGHSMNRRAERANFVHGTNWSECAAGTNAPGLSLHTGRPASVFANEHWCESVQDWVCYAAPMRDAGGSIVGVLDLSAHWSRASPLALATVTAYARLVENELARHQPAPVPAVRLSVLGDTRVLIAGRPVQPTLRQLEILVILALRESANLDELHAHLYGDRDVSPTTVKSEVSHLRRLLGPEVIGSRPYRIAVGHEIDVVLALEAIRRGDLDTALHLYRGPLLPASESPLVAEYRCHVDVALRDQLVRNGRASQLRRFLDLHPGDEQIRTALASR